MTVRELRQKYLDFFRTKGHDVFPSGSLVPYDVTGKLDESLLFNGAGMVQFKPFFRGAASPPNARLTTCQKCVRTGDIETVGDLTHLTFFEMLGNFSFGDYFKDQAVAYSWEFLTSPEWLGLDPTRLSFTVFEEDDVAYEAWSRHLLAAGIDPATRIFRLGEETNYWPAGAYTFGPPGPCGPNSEMFYWTAPEPPPSAPYSAADYLRDEAAGKWLEIWNDVFIQYEWQGRLKDPERPALGYEKTGMPELPFRSIDTGMGLERTAAVLSGFSSVYDTDAFTPIIATIVAIGDHRFEYGTDPARDTAIRIIADHIRTACFCIVDGILPGNTGRGYVLRRLIRRAVLKGQRVLGFSEPFFHLVVSGVLEALGNHYGELIERREMLLETLRNEESQFRRTVAQGFDSLSLHLDELRTQGQTVLSGEIAFKLYDTYGFPLEVTQEICEESNIHIDLDGYEEALKEAQERSRGASGMDTVYADQEALVLSVSSNAWPQSVFVGYDAGSWRSEIGQISPRFGPDGLTTGEFQFCLNETPFYAQSGGQIGDTGTVSCDGFSFEVSNTWKEMGLIWHDAILTRIDEAFRSQMFGPQGDFEAKVDSRLLRGLREEEILHALDSGFFFREVEASVDMSRRRAITRNHTATHLLHAALRARLGKHVTQAGSLVAPHYLRFDFTHGKAMSPEELADVERTVNEKALENAEVSVFADVPIAEAKRRGAMALFGEKYGDTVRMVQVGDFSLELCGGCHVRTTGEIGLFKILHEGSAASGVRRIEAVTGLGAYDWVVEQVEGLRSAATLVKSSPSEIQHAIEKLLDQNRELQKRMDKMRSQAVTASEASTELIGEVELAMESIADADPKEATLVADRLAEGKPNRVVVVGLTTEGKATFVAKVGPDAQAKGAHAGNLVREVAKIAGGGGGGRPDFATAGGKDASKVREALEAAKAVLAGQVGA